MCTVEHISTHSTVHSRYLITLLTYSPTQVKSSQAFLSLSLSFFPSRPLEVSK